MPCFEPVDIGRQSMNTQIYKGQCFCGMVKFEVSGPHQSACYCHCESCRLASGAPYLAWGSFPRQSLKVTGGELSIHQSSESVTRGFCGNCGTTISYEHALSPDHIDITLVTLEGQNRPTPAAHIWVSDKEASVRIADNLPQFAEWRTG